MIDEEKLSRLEREKEEYVRERAVTNIELETIQDIKTVITHKELYTDGLPKDFLIDLKVVLRKIEKELLRWRRGTSENIESVKNEIIEVQYEVDKNIVRELARQQGKGLQEYEQKEEVVKIG